MEQRSNKMEQKFEPMLVPENSDIFTKTLIPPIVDQNEKNAFNAIQRKVRCGIRNKVRYLYNLKIIRIDTIDIFIRYTLSITIRSRSFFDFFRSNKTSDNSSRETLDHRAFFFFFQTVVLSILLRFSLIARIFYDPSLRRKNETKLDFRVPRRFIAGKKSRGWNVGPIDRTWEKTPIFTRIFFLLALYSSHIPIRSQKRETTKRSSVFKPRCISIGIKFKIFQRINI